MKCVAMVRLTFVLLVLVAPPWILSRSIECSDVHDFISKSRDVYSGGAGDRFERLLSFGINPLIVLIFGICWVRITTGFVLYCFRLLVRRPLEKPRVLSARLALWALMISPTVVATMATPVHASVEVFETTESDFDSRIIPTTPVMVSALVACGVLFRLRSRHRRGLRQDEANSMPEVEHWESFGPRQVDELIIVRIELAIRSLMLIAPSFRMLVVRPDTTLLVEFPQDRTPRSPWVRHAPRVWKLDSSIELGIISAMTASNSGSLPVMLPVGTTAGGEVWINLQEVGIFGIHGDGSCAEVVWRGIGQTLALSPFTEHVSLISTDPMQLRGRREIVMSDELEVHQMVTQLHTDECPVVVLADRRPDAPIPGIVVHRNEPFSGEFGLSGIGGRWFLQPMGIEIDPIRCSDADLALIDSLVPEIEPMITTNHGPHPASPSAWIQCPHRFIVSVLGVPHVRHVDGRRVSFERRRSEELVVWLSTHPDRQRRSLARDEMWSIPVKDSTFANVVSDARRCLTVIETLVDGEDWIRITLNDELPLHHLVVTDAQLLALCFEHARRRPEEDGREVLEFGLSLVNGVPFSGSNYLWRDSTGLGSEYAQLVVRSALLLADMWMDAGAGTEFGFRKESSSDNPWIEGVYWATAKGLLAVPGHEELVKRRMELHARTGDHAALLGEWKAYCRVLTTDDWGDVEPSPKMVATWRRLSRSTGGTSSVVEEFLGL